MRHPQAILILSQGFEDIEAIAPLDILRRGGVDALSLSVTGDMSVQSKCGVTVTADGLLEDYVDTLLPGLDMIILPGGPGHKAYFDNSALSDLIRKHHEAGGWLAAICAAPVYLGYLGLLEGREAVCYPGLESGLTGARLSREALAADNRIITAKGPGWSVEFGLNILKVLQGQEEADGVKKDLCLS